MSILDRFRNNQEAREATMEVTVTNWGKEEKVTVRSIGFREKIKLQTMAMSPSRTERDAESINIQGEALASFGLHVLSKCVVEIAQLSDADLLAVGCNSHIEFAEKHFDDKAAQTLFDTIIMHSGKLENIEDEAVGEVGEAVKN